MNKRAIKSGIELFLIMVSVIVAAYAWLTYQTNAKPTDLTMKTQSFIDLLLSMDGGETWTNETSLDLPSDFVFGNEVTSDGINFYVKNLEKDDGTPINFKLAEKNKDYIEFEVQFKSTMNSGVFLEANSYIQPLAGTTADDLIGTDVEAKSNSGDFSRDLIAGAVRVAVIKNELIDNKYYPVNTPSIVWAPNPNINVNCATGTCNASITSNELQNYSYVDATDAYYYTEKMPINIKDHIRASYDANSSNGDPMLFYIDDVDKTYSTTIRIWIEGNDRDAVTALTGGEFVISLSFIAFNKQLNNNTPVVTVNNNNLVGLLDSMEVSLDYGLTWKTDVTELDSGKTAYVRYSETVNTFASDYIIIIN